MSRFGDREFMNDLSDMLEQRAAEVGERQMLQELAQVMATHAEYYWQEKSEC